MRVYTITILLQMVTLATVLTYMFQYPFYWSSTCPECCSSLTTFMIIFLGSGYITFISLYLSFCLTFSLLLLLFRHTCIGHFRYSKFLFKYSALFSCLLMKFTSLFIFYSSQFSSLWIVIQFPTVVTANLKRYFMF